MDSGDSWTRVRPTGASDAATERALEKLLEASILYDRYLAIARLNEFPSIPEFEAAEQTPWAPTDRPLGLVIEPAPMGIDFTKRPKPGV